MLGGAHARSRKTSGANSFCTARLLYRAGSTVFEWPKFRVIFSQTMAPELQPRYARALGSMRLGQKVRLGAMSPSFEGDKGMR